ncbi:MAG: hypothetical protein Q8Q06_03970 [bacterium]|nr:hypothetical protein [bacterium]
MLELKNLLSSSAIFRFGVFTFVLIAFVLFFAYICHRFNLLRFFNNKTLVGLFILINILDVHSTYVNYVRDGWHGEINILARELFRKFGFWNSVFIHKIPFTLLISWLFIKNGFHIFLLALSISFLIIVLQNYMLYFKWI